METGPEERARQELAARIDRTIEAQERRKLLSRRELLRRSGLALVTIGAAPSILAACGGGSEAETSGGGATTAPAATGAPAATTGAGAAPATELGGELSFLSWEGYDLPDIITPWLDENGITLTPTYLGDHNEIQAKLLASGGNAGFDIITYYQGYSDFYRQLEILSPLDEERIPNLSTMFPFFSSDVGNYWVDTEGVRTGVPWTWQLNGLAYDEAEVPALDSYRELLDSQYTGRVGIANDPIGGIQLVAQTLGYDYTEIPKDAVPELQDFLVQLFGQAKTVSPTFGDATSLIVAGDVFFVFPGWAAIQKFAADAGKDTVRTVIPTEGGGQLSTDAWAIPPGADNVDAAYGWINETLVPEIQAAAAESLVAGVVVEDAVPLLSPEAVAVLPYYDNLEESISSQLSGLPPQESDEYVTFQESIDIWTEAAAAGGGG
jgi:spermidine/putrescine-binding protein